MASIRDRDWTKQIFVMDEASLGKEERKAQFWSPAMTSFTDSTLGGSLELNPVPQFTSAADLKQKSRFSGSEGVGRFWEEAINQNSERIYLRAGVPSYTSLTNFFTTFYNPSMGVLARTGRPPGWFYTLGQVTGWVLTVPLQLINYIGRGVRWLFGLGSGASWYRLKPTMPLFWEGFNNVLNYIGINKGITLPYEDEIDRKVANGHLNKFMPDIFKEDGRIDIYAVANKAQRLANKQIESLENAMGSAKDQNDLNEKITLAQSGSIFDDERSASIDAALKRYMDMETNKYEDDGDFSSESSVGWYENYLTEFIDAFNSERREGSEYLCLRVNKTGEITESFSNGTKASPLEEKLNGMSSAAQASKFSFAGGNLGDGAIATAVETLVGSAADFVGGVADQIGASGLAVMSGAGFADIQQMYDQSTADLPSMSYSIDLRHPYAGNPLVQYLYFMPVIAAMLTLALPRSVGPRSYTAPFLVELFHPGTNIIRTGMIDSFSITRNVGNLGKNQRKDSLGYKIDFTIKDMSSVMHVPLKTDNSILDMEHRFNDYLGILANMDLKNFIYRTKSAGIAWKRWKYDWVSDFSPASMANWALSGLGGDVLKALSRGTATLGN